MMPSRPSRAEHQSSRPSRAEHPRGALSWPLRCRVNDAEQAESCRAESSSLQLTEIGPRLELFAQQAMNFSQRVQVAGRWGRCQHCVRAIRVGRN